MAAGHGAALLDVLPVHSEAFWLASLGAVSLAVSLTFLVYTYFWKPLTLLACLKRQGIPGCSFRPFLGQVPELRESIRKARADPSPIKAPTPFLDELVEKYGGNCYYCIGPVPRLILTDPALIRQAYVNHIDLYHKSTFIRAFALFGNGLVTASGDLWARQRRLINPAFHHKEIKRMYEAMVGCATKVVQDWSDKLKDQPKEFEVFSELGELALSIIGKAAFGADIGDTGKEAQESLRHLKTYFEDVVKFYRGQGLIPIVRYFPSAEKRRIKAKEAAIREVMLGMIKRRRIERQNRSSLLEESAPVDLLELMLSSTGEAAADDNKGQPLMTDQQLMDECITFLVAGHETTANLLTWTVLLLSEHPEWQEKGREEVTSVCGEREPPSFEQLSQLKVLTTILYESLRLYPPASFLARTCVRSNRLNDILVPKGVDIVVPIALIHRKKELWGEDAHEFNPRRFANGISKAGAHPLAFLPFSVGPRTCIGQTFALTEAKLILAMLLQSFTWKVAPGYRHCPEVVLTLKPKYGLPVIFEKISRQESEAEAAPIT